MSPVTIVLLVILAVLIAATIALIFLGKKAQKRKDEQDAQLAATAQTVTMLIIDILLGHRLCGIDSHQRYLRTSLWLHCLCLGWFRRLWNSHASLLLCRSEEVSYQLSGEGDYDLCGSRPHPLRRNDRG